jgi:hypothetical protein
MSQPNLYITDDEFREITASVEPQTERLFTDLDEQPTQEFVFTLPEDYECQCDECLGLTEEHDVITQDDADALMALLTAKMEQIEAEQQAIDDDFNLFLAERAVDAVQDIDGIRVLVNRPRLRVTTDNFLGMRLFSVTTPLGTLAVSVSR